MLKAGQPQHTGQPAHAGQPPKTALPLETVLFCVFTLIALAVIALTQLGLPVLLPPPVVQLVILGVLVGVLGLPHGALDPLIARRAGLWRRPLGFLGFNLGYIALVAAVVAVWILAPGPSLGFFLLISGIHFGADWNADRSLWLRIPPGLALLTLPAWAHHAEVAAIYRTLAGTDGVMIANLQNTLGPAALGVMLLGAVVAIRSKPHHALELLLAAALAALAPPLIFFVIYFCALHSVRHLTHGFRVGRAAGMMARSARFARLAVTAGPAASTGRGAFLGPVASARRAISWPIIIVVGYTLGPILAVAALWGSFGSVSLSDRMTQLVFIGLAALTVPHMVVVAAEARTEPPVRGIHLSKATP
ncbi:MAG: Brp/Blh family beta-carotene 15,15'-dioxygenase [Microbacteriaceae bacterium]|nr:Brp/Blh family beta-carotene 15,15'-dioxygenase [Microbacteriaceae bacterium]